MMAHRNEGGYGAEASQHPRLNRERDLWRGRVSLERLSNWSDNSLQAD